MSSAPCGPLLTAVHLTVVSPPPLSTHSAAALATAIGSGRSPIDALVGLGGRLGRLAVLTLGTAVHTPPGLVVGTCVESCLTPGAPRTAPDSAVRTTSRMRSTVTVPLWTMHRQLHRPTVRALRRLLTDAVVWTVPSASRSYRGSRGVLVAEFGRGLEADVLLASAVELSSAMKHGTRAPHLHGVRHTTRALHREMAGDQGIDHAQTVFVMYVLRLPRLLRTCRTTSARPVSWARSTCRPAAWLWSGLWTLRVPILRQQRRICPCR